MCSGKGIPGNKTVFSGKRGRRTMLVPIIHPRGIGFPKKKELISMPIHSISPSPGRMRL
jgi:hypothetical protein